jgi:hypothetical protein
VKSNGIPRIFFTVSLQGVVASKKLTAEGLAVCEQEFVIPPHKKTNIAAKQEVAFFMTINLSELKWSWQ